MALLLVLLLATDVESRELHFKISLPKKSAGDWTVGAAPGDGKNATRVRFRTVFAGVKPRSYCDVQLIVSPVQAGRKLEQIAVAWRKQMDGGIERVRKREERTGSLGGEPAHVADVRGSGAGAAQHVTWILAKRDGLGYALHIRRVNEAIGDDDLEREVEEIRNSFRFLAAAQPEGKPGDEPGPEPVPRQEPAPKQDPRRAMRLDFWRLECVKPEGLAQVAADRFDASEKALGCILKLVGLRKQSRCLVRVFARRAGDRERLDQLQRRRIEEFEKTCAKRLPPKVDRKWKPPLARKTLRLELVGIRTVRETTWWHLADCRNKIQYQVQFYVSGTTGASVWKDALADFLAHFKPTRR